MSEPVIIGDAQLWLGDCREILPRLGKVDAVVTDPPYGVLDETWDDMTRRELARFTMSWLGLAAGLSETALIFFGERTRRIASPLLELVYDDVRQIIWDKRGGNVAEDRLFYSFESVYLCHPPDNWETAEPKALHVAGMLSRARIEAGLSRGAIDMLVRGKKTGLCFRWEEAACLPTPEQVTKLRTAVVLPFGFDVAYSEACAVRTLSVEAARSETAKRAAGNRDVFSIAPPHSKSHPTEKPADLMRSLLLAVDINGTILDPFMGSGTTGVACAKLGRKFIGVEINEKYFNIAVKRITEAYAQPDFFVEKPVEPKQEAFKLDAEEIFKRTGALI